MNPLALDLGTRGVGWACAGTRGQASVGPKRPMQETDRWACMADGISLLVTGLIDDHRPDCAVIERPFYSPKFPRAGLVLHVLLGPVLVVLRRRELLTDLVEPCTWQRWAHPRGWDKRPGEDSWDAHWIREWFLAIRVPLIRSTAA